MLAAAAAPAAAAESVAACVKATVTAAADSAFIIGRGFEVIAFERAFGRALVSLQKGCFGTAGTAGAVCTRKLDGRERTTSSLLAATALTVSTTSYMASSVVLFICIL